MKRVFSLLYTVGVLLMCVGSSGFAQMVEAPVDVKVEYVPRTTDVASTETLTTAQVLAKLGFKSGSLVCVADGSDVSVPWSFKVKTVQGTKTSYTELNGKLEFEVLGDSLLGVVNAVSTAAPAMPLSLGKPLSTRTVKAEIVLGDTEGFDFYGTVVTSYNVTQEAGKKVSTWMPEACTAKMAGTYRSVSGEKASTASITAVVGAFKGTAATSAPVGTVSVLGGKLPSGSELVGWVVGNFYIGKTEVTWDQWKEVREWAVKNGYTDLANVGASTGGNYPVTSVNWYDVVKWCNAKSEKEGKMPVYQVNGRTYKIGKGEPIVKTGAKGYRLPTEAEWEWAARGGRQTHGHAFSGSDDLNEVGWFDGNAGGGIHQVGKKSANELGISDMSGNVWEWCADWYPGYEGSIRVLRGGYWYGLAAFCTVANRNDGNPGSRFSNCGFRVALNSFP